MADEPAQLEAERKKRTAHQLHGYAVLNDIEGFLSRFVAYPDLHSRIAHTLWIAHAHLTEHFESTPRLAFLSPEPSSGKTRALEITEMLVPNPVEAVNVTPAYLFRKVGDDERKPTILYDEIDTVFGPKAKDNEEIRGLLNAGHRKGAVAGRCVTVGKAVKTEEISAYCAVALAGLGNLPDTILTRSVVIRMKRRAPNEKVEAYRRRVHRPQGEQHYQLLAQWCARIAGAVGDAYPKIPAEVQDRDADVWEPLLAIADAAGGGWPEQAREAAVTLVTAAKDDTPSLGIRLLGDVREAFGDSPAMFTADILSALNGLEEAPWGDLRGHPLDARRLASMLRRYITIPEGERSKTIRIGDRTAKGYRAEWLYDAWGRYLASPSQASQPPREQKKGHFPAPAGVTDSVTDVTDAGIPPSQIEQATTRDVADVTGVTDLPEREGDYTPGEVG